MMQSPISYSGQEQLEPRSLNFTLQASPTSASPSPSMVRLWKPAAQRNLRNQWSTLISNKRRWESAASEGRSSATVLINAYLSRRYMPNKDLGVLTEMADIRQKACEKLALRQERCRGELLSSYKDLVHIVCQLVNACNSMRCFLKGSSAGPLVQFTHNSQDQNDPGDGGGIAVFSFWPLSYFEELAQELVEMFVLEMNFKRLIMVQLLSISLQEAPSMLTDVISWSSELYDSEFEDLSTLGLLCRERCQPIPPRIKDFEYDNSMTEQVSCNPDRVVLQVYLTAWISDVNVDMRRVDEIFSAVEEEMQVKLC